MLLGVEFVRHSPVDAPSADDRLAEWIICSAHCTCHNARGNSSSSFSSFISLFLYLLFVVGVVLLVRTERRPLAPDIGAQPPRHRVINKKAIKAIKAMKAAHTKCVT